MQVDQTAVKVDLFLRASGLLIPKYTSVAPLYHVSLLDRPVIVWDFYSLATELQMMANIMLADKEHPMKLCRNCMNAFIADNPADTFCCPECKDKYNSRKNPESK